MSEQNEVLRLVSELIDAAHGTVMNEDQSREDETRAALLAHIERGRVPEGWELVPVEPTDEMLAVWLTPEQRDGGKSGGNMQPWSRALRFYDAMLAAAPAEPDHSATVPDSPEDMWNALHRIDSAAAILPTYSVKHEGGLDAFAQNIIDAIQGIAAATVPAEVLMPKPVAYGFGNTAITGHTNRLMMVRIDIPGGDQYAGAFWHPLVLADEARTYGTACRAAGEAAGYARGLKEAGRDADVFHDLTVALRALLDMPDNENTQRHSRLLLQRAEAAMRGEVKP